MDRSFADTDVGKPGTHTNRTAYVQALLSICNLRAPPATPYGSVARETSAHIIPAGLDYPCFACDARDVLSSSLALHALRPCL